MAESAVSFLLGKLDLLLLEEARLLGGVRREVGEIMEELESMRSFLRDANARGDSEETVKTWVRQVREEALDIEDILDEFTLRLAGQRRVGGRFFSSLFRKGFLFVQHLKARHRIATQIQDIKSRVISISARKDRYNLVSTPEKGPSSTAISRSWYDLREDALLLEEAEIVGMDKHLGELIGCLLKGEARLTVISVVGMAGSGKTTLVKKAFDSQSVKASFECFAWTTVSQSFKIEELLRNLIKTIFESKNENLPQDLDRVNAQRLREMLKDYLQQKRYVLVFDDLWSINEWKSIKNALPDSKCGSRIIITTRDLSVASSCGGVYGHVYDLKPLPPNFAWELFCKKAFPANSQEGSCPLEFKEVSQYILKRCKGLPLAIVTIGSLLSNKQTLVEWQQVYQHIGSDLESDDGLQDMMRILLLSYNNLPYHLKCCFLYLGIFPEDYSIKCTKLIRLWIAEGFVQGREGRTKEDVAEGYLKDLINRNMVQIAKLNHYGRLKCCRVHDLMRDVILTKEGKVGRRRMLQRVILRTSSIETWFK